MSNDNFSSGLKNIGNTCYMNSGLQCLITVPTFSGLIVSPKKYDKHLKNKNESMIHTLNKLFREMLTSKTAVSPRNFKARLSRRVPMFRGSEQHDSQEFLVFLLDILHEEIKYKLKEPVGLINSKKPIDVEYNRVLTEISKNMSSISKVFSGIEMNSISCAYCKNTHYRANSFNILSIPILQDTKSLYDCIESYFKSTISEDYKCETCKSDNVSINSKIHHSPMNLIVQLKRFSINECGYFTKNNKNISIPIELNINKYTHDSKASYKLSGVVCHSGSLRGGHYTALTKDPRNDSWNNYNDSSVNNIKEIKNVLNQQVYILFYSR